MILSTHIARVARTWVGTPFHAGQCVKGQGADCAGVLLGILHEAGVGDWRHFLASRPRAIPAEYIRTLIAQTPAYDHIEGDPCVGEVLLGQVGGLEQHLAIVVGETVVHALAQYRSVRETPFCMVGTTFSRWRFPNVDYEVQKWN